MTGINIPGVGINLEGGFVDVGGPDTIPDQFTFIDQIDVPIAPFVVTSNEITVTGIDPTANIPISVSLGEYQINDGAWLSAPGIVGLNDRVRVRHTASVTANGTPVNQQVIIGGVQDTFTSTTAVTNDAFFDSNAYLVLGDCQGETACNLLYGTDPLQIDAGREGSWTGPESGVFAAAADPAGPAVAGLRQFYDDPKDSGSSPHRIAWPDGTGPTEIWIRAYVRYEVGFDPGGLNSHKWYYIHYDDTNGAPFVIPQPYQERFRFAGCADARDIQSVPFSGTGWRDYFGNTSDGLHHCMECHIKIDDGISANGICQFWAEGNLIIDFDDVDISGGDANYLNGVNYMDFFSNHNIFLNGGIKYLDLSDILIYLTTPPNTDANGNPYIGPR